MEEITAIAHDIGFDFCAYGLRMPVPVSRPKMVMFSNYPAAWQTRYWEGGYVGVDPTVHHGMRSLLPIVWSDEVFASAPELWEEARSFGLRVGWAQSSRDSNAVAGLLTLARGEDPLTDSELRAKRLMMAWLTQVAHLGMSRCLTTKLLPEGEIRADGAGANRAALDGRRQDGRRDLHNHAHLRIDGQFSRQKRDGEVGDSQQAGCDRQGGDAGVAVLSFRAILGASAVGVAMSPPAPGRRRDSRRIGS